MMCVCMEPLEQTKRLRTAEAEVFEPSWLVGSTKPRPFNPEKTQHQELNADHAVLRHSARAPHPTRGMSDDTHTR